jgi:hypothetical protein
LLSPVAIISLGRGQEIVVSACSLLFMQDAVGSREARFLRRVVSFFNWRAAGVGLILMLGGLPAYFLQADIRRFAVNVPFMDDWQFIPLVEKARDGTLKFGDLWAPHDEHRLLIPRIIIIASMLVSGGDYRLQCAITFGVVTMISGCLLWLLVHLNGWTLRVAWAWLLMNIALFSPIQFHNWLWPMQFAYFLPYAFLALCFCVLYAQLNPWVKFTLATACAVAGNCSFVQGNLIWLAALPLIMFAPGILPDPARRPFAAAWVIAGICMTGVYFYGLGHNSAAKDYAYGLQGISPMTNTLIELKGHPGATFHQMGGFVLAMFGNSISRGFPIDNLLLSRRLGAATLILAVLALLAAWRLGSFRQRALPWACLLLFTFLTAAFVCVGRVWLGEYQPLTPRYTTFGTFCLVALVALTASIFPASQGVPASGEVSSAPRWSRPLVWMQGVLLGAYLILQSVSWAYGKHLMEEWNLARWRSRASLRFFDTLPSKGLDLLGGNYQLLASQMKSLERLGMLVPPVARDLRISKLGRDCGILYTGRGEFQRLYRLPDGRWHASGYAICNDERPPDIVLLCTKDTGGEWTARAAVTPRTPPMFLRRNARMDYWFLAVPEMLEDMPLAEWGTWQAELPSNTFGNQTSGTVAAWAYDYERNNLYRIPGDHELSPELMEPVTIRF